MNKPQHHIRKPISNQLLALVADIQELEKQNAHLSKMVIEANSLIARVEARFEQMGVEEYECHPQDDCAPRIKDALLHGIRKYLYS